MVDILDINVHNIGAKVILVIDILGSCTLIVGCVTLFMFDWRIGS